MQTNGAKNKHNDDDKSDEINDAVHVERPHSAQLTRQPDQVVQIGSKLLPYNAWAGSEFPVLPNFKGNAGLALRRD